MRFLYILVLVQVSPLAAQSLQIYSEFQRIDPFGNVVAVDRSDHPREILSPEVARNGHASFHVALSVPANTSYFLYAASNPPNIIETALYKEDFTRTGGVWYPDALTPVRRPAFGFMPDAAAAIPGQTTRCYLLDVWVPPDTPVQRVRIEVLMKIGVWYVAPMEVRIVEAQVPRHNAQFTMGSSRRYSVDDRADLPAMECLAKYLLGGEQTWEGGITNIRDVIRRDAEQDMAIARRLPHVPRELGLLADEGIVQWWMCNPGFNWSGAEWYLRVRDWIYRKSL